MIEDKELKQQLLKELAKEMRKMMAGSMKKGEKPVAVSMEVASVKPEDKDSMQDVVEKVMADKEQNSEPVDNQQEETDELTDMNEEQKRKLLQRLKAELGE